MDNQEIQIPDIRIIKNTKKYIKKNGDEVVKIYNQKNYNEKYYKKNKDKFKETYLCIDCNKNVLKANKFNHEHTKSHILQSKYKIDFKNI